MKSIPLLLFLLLGSWASADESATLIAQGDAHDLRFEPKQALAFYLKAEPSRSKDATLLVKIARQYVYLMDERPSKKAKEAAARTALEYSQRAVRAAPDTSDPYLSVAISYGKLTPLLGTREKITVSRKLKEAAEKAIRFDPKSDYAWHLLGRWHQTLAGVGGISRTIAKLVYGTIPKASYSEALRCFEQAMKLNPDRLIHVIELGRTHALMGNEALARQFIEQGLAMKNTERDDPGTKTRGRATLKSL